MEVHRAHPEGRVASKSFEYGTGGGEIRAEFTPKPGATVATEHWCSSGFANTDFDLQLKKQGIHRLIVTGLMPQETARTHQGR
jgi:nicotinamidase-related amidase